MQTYLQSSATNNFFLLAGPCAIESEEIAMVTAEKLVEVTSALQIPLVFKGSYRTDHPGKSQRAVRRACGH